MLIIKVDKNESIDIALKRYKYKFRKTKVVEELRDRMEYKKPSVKKRSKKKKAIYIQKLKNKEE